MFLPNLPVPPWVDSWGPRNLSVYGSRDLGATVAARPQGAPGSREPDTHTYLVLFGLSAFIGFGLLGERECRHGTA